MQYIQLQPQDSSTIATPPTGSFNFFIDANDNTHKTKGSDDALYIPPSYPILRVTAASLTNAKTQATLVAGQLYCITDAGSWYLPYPMEVIVMATSTNTVSNNGYGKFYNPKYHCYSVWSNTTNISVNSQNGYFIHDEPIVGDNAQSGNMQGLPGSSSLTFVQTGGDWSIGGTLTGVYSEATLAFSGGINYAASYAKEDKVIWGGLVWRNTNGGVGQTTGGWPTYAFALNSEDWEPIEYNTTDYKMVWDEVKYDLTNDSISYRRDSRGNEVTSNFNWTLDYFGMNIVRCFPWGNTNVDNCQFKDCYLHMFVNYLGSASNITIDTRGGLNAHYWGKNMNMSNINLEMGAHLVSMNLGDSARMDQITIEQDGYLDNLYLANNDNNYTQLETIKIGQSAELYNLKVLYNSSLQGFIMEPLSDCSCLHIFENSWINNVSVGYDSELCAVFLGPSSNIYQIKIENSSSICGVWMGVNSSMNNVELSGDSYINGVNIPDNSAFEEISMASNSYIENYSPNSTSVMFNNVRIGINSGISNFYPDGSSSTHDINISNGVVLSNVIVSAEIEFGYIEMLTNSFITNSTIGSNMYNLSIGVGLGFNSISFVSPITYAEFNNGGSSLYSTIDISGLTTIDLSSVSYAGVVYLTSTNPTETIDSIIGEYGFWNVKLVPISGLSVTFTGTSTESISANGAIVMPTSSFTARAVYQEYLQVLPVQGQFYEYFIQTGGSTYL